MQQLMDHTYQTFIGHVAAGRRMSRSAVEGIASGRVWTGAAAQKIGLVDELGGLDRAVEIARQRGADRRRRDGRPRLLPVAAVVARSLPRETAAAPPGSSRGGRQGA